MSIFDEIEADAKAGTPGDWSTDEGGEVHQHGSTIFAWPQYSDQSDLEKLFADLRRGARVPQLERIALAAQELAEAAYLALSLIDQDNLENKAGWDSLDATASHAITVFREVSQ